MTQLQTIKVTDSTLFDLVNITLGPNTQFHELTRILFLASKFTLPKQRKTRLYI